MSAQGLALMHGRGPSLMDTFRARLAQNESTDGQAIRVQMKREVLRDGRATTF